MTEDELKKLTKKQLIERLLKFEKGEMAVKNQALPIYFGTFYSDVEMKVPSFMVQGTCMACINGTCTIKGDHT